KRLLTPPGGGPKPALRPCSGEPSYTTTATQGRQHLSRRGSLAHERKAAVGIGCWKPSVVVSDLGAREAGNLGTAAVSERRAAINERRRRNSILRAGGGLVNPEYQ